MVNLDEFETFGEFVKYYRQKSGVSSKKLSAQLNKGAAYISQIENNRIMQPDYNTAVELLKIIRIKPDIIDHLLRHFHIVEPNKERGVLEDLVYQSAMDMFNEFDVNKNTAEQEDEITDEELIVIQEEIKKSIAIIVKTNPKRAKKVLNHINNLLLKEKEVVAREYTHKMMSNPEVLDTLIKLFEKKGEE